jgi:hypothetical protein
LRPGWLGGKRGKEFSGKIFLVYICGKRVLGFENVFEESD